MEIVIRTRQLDLTPALRDHVRRRLAFALGRLGPAVRAVQVTLADVNGPRGGVDSRAVR
jgi:putative sigma-54 modulation protein